MTTTDVGSSVLLSMGNGSGIDILKLARDLTDAEQLPQQNRIETAQRQDRGRHIVLCDSQIQCRIVERTV